MEYASSVLVHALLVSCIYLILMWLFVRWICLVMNTRRETFKAMRNKLVSCTVLGCLLFLVVCWYVQRLSTVAENLKTMARHADVAVETLNAYEEQRKKLNDFFDQFYLTQASIASVMIRNADEKSLTWEDLQRYADTLQIKYIYLFDKDGKVIVTNAPYDTMTVSTNPEDFSYQFRRVLEGVDSLVLDPMEDEWRKEYIQYIAVNVRDKNNRNDGLVLIGIDPTLRDRLLSPLNVDTVLENLIIGLPEEAIAVDKETLRIAATTGLGYKGNSVAELGISPEVLTDDFSGFLKINGRDYYAAVSDSAQYYLMPVMEREGGLGAVLISLKLTLVALLACILVLLITLIPYQKVVIDGAPEREEEEPETDPVEEQNIDEEEDRLFSGIQNLLKTQQKKGMENRWHMNDIPKDQLTPEQRISKSIYRILLLFCLVILLPTLYSVLEGRADPNRMNNLAYVISGNWQKGLNIFAFTSCLFLLCGMYVVVVLVNQILYRIAKISNMRVETVCLLIKNAIKYVCVIVFVYYGLSRFGVQTQTLLASAGIFSMMIGFGAKDLVGDIVAGFFTIVEGTYKVGDFVTIGGWSGTVVEIGLRTTKVQAFADTKVFNNSAIREVINANGEVARMVLKAPISYEADLNKVEAILNEELPKMMDVIPGLVKPPAYEGVDKLGDNSVELCITIFVKTSSKMRAIRALTREIKLLFDREGIEIPYNQLVLHNAKEPEPVKDHD
jgi:small conductance mechanosensitive channel